jgi:hypothetical protein
MVTALFLDQIIYIVQPLIFKNLPPHLNTGMFINVIMPRKIFEQSSLNILQQPSLYLRNSAISSRYLLGSLAKLAPALAKTVIRSLSVSAYFAPKSYLINPRTTPFSFSHIIAS